MKSLFVIGGLAASLGLGGLAQAATVTLDLDGLQSRGGNVLVALQSKDQFLKPAVTAGASIRGSIDGKTRVTLTDVPPGEYALTVLHDADGDMTMKVASDGRPLEGWSTKNAASLRATPTFDQVSFTVDGDLTLKETMIYPKP